MTEREKDVRQPNLLSPLSLLLEQLSDEEDDLLSLVSTTKTPPVALLMSLASKSPPVKLPFRLKKAGISQSLKG